MIKYSLRCSAGHDFESWFASASAYDALAESGLLVCAICGGSEVEKALMAPRVAPSRSKAPPPEAAPDTPVPQNATRTPRLSEAASPMEAALAEFRAKVEANTVDVGRSFATEARAIHEGTAPQRAIRGEANVKEARALLEDGVPVLPLPFMPTRQVN